MSRAPKVPSLKTGSIAPNFEANSSSGPLKLHQWSGESWAIVFSHPGSAFATEITEVARRLSDFEKRNIKLVGFSRNWLEENRHWNKLLHHYYAGQPGAERGVQIAADDQGNLSSLYGMISQRDSKGSPTIPNTAFLVDPMKHIRLVFAYPSTLSNGIDKLLRFVDDNSGPLQDIPTEIFGLDAKGQGQIYEAKSLAESGGGGGSSAITIVTGAVSLASNVKGAMGSSSGDGSSNSIVTEATDYIQNAMQVMDTLADLGKVLPFVAPAFVIIKAIIAVEQRARDVDAKCTDLVQRCTFMLSHLPSLKKINVTSTTRQVIDRMNDTLKKAAALIQTYRKQSALTRRLSVHNKDRFAASAASLKDCTNDLMISLQIHQSVQLDILTRPIPSDPEDEAAEKFVASHGGLDAVKGNEELVKQFASEMKLSVDDKVMEQLNSNITLALQQNQDRLEQSLTESVSASVVDGIRGLAAQMNESAKEQTFVCVQCDKEYRDSTNGEKSCSYHRDEYDSWRKSYGCCSTKNPCQAGSHRSEHHCDYPYGNFFPFVRGITNYVDTTETWAEVEDTNLETSAKVQASVARLLRWKSRGAVPDLPSILIRVGQLSIKEPYLFKVFNTKDLEVISQVVEITHQTVIFRTSHSTDEFAMAEWVLSSEGVIAGVKITAKAAVSDTPFVRYCPIDITKCTLSGEVRALSEGGLLSYKPATPYVLPEVQRVSGTLLEKTPREVRKDFKTRTSPNLPVLLKPLSEPPLAANPDFANALFDNFTGTVSVFNKHPTESSQTISFSSVTAFYRLVGDKEYKPVEKLELLDGVVLPYSVDPKQTWPLKFQVFVPRSAEDAALQVKWWNRAFIARQRPLRIKLVLTDVEDEECSLVLDYVCRVFAPSAADTNDLAFFYVDDPMTWSRFGVHVANGGNPGSVKIYNEERNADALKAIVYNALKTGESEISLNKGPVDVNPGQPDSWSYEAWALIDLPCKRIYAFKILITKILNGKGYACLGYAPCPEYGDFYDETRPIRYAVETVGFPVLEPYASPEVILDDTFDDFVPEVPKPIAAVPSGLPSSIGAGLPAQLVVPEELSQRLTSIDTSLSRLATFIEQLVEILKAR